MVRNRYDWTQAKFERYVKDGDGELKGLAPVKLENDNFKCDRLQQKI